MMKLGTMQAVVATVNEQWESPLADALLQHWEHDAGHAKYWRASANFIFFFKNQGRDFVLRFNHADERTAAAIQAEVAYVNALAAQGIRVATPVRSASGNYVESIDTPQGLFHTVAFVALPGEQLDLDELSSEQMIRWGRALGQLHQAAARVDVPDRPSWETHLEWVSATLPAEETSARRALDEITHQLRQIPISEQNFGLIHFDFELDNLIWDGEDPGIIDFDDCAGYWFVADIAFALRDLFGDSASRVDLQHESVRQFVEGYRSVRPLEQDELALIPLFLQMHNVLTLAKLHRAMTPVNPAGEPTWMGELRDKLSAKMQFYRDELAR